MRISILGFFLFLGLGLLAPAHPAGADETPAEAELKNIDAFQALAIGNRWRWTHKEVKSHVTSREVIFKFPDGKMKKIPLPEDKMVVAVAPYINRTHT